MWNDVLRRFGYSLLVIFLVTVGVQALMALAPGSVATVILGEAATPEKVGELNHELGLDRPFFVRYFDWLGSAVQGDLGTSPVSHSDVTSSILQRLPVTLELAVLALVIALLVAIPLAVLSASFPDSALDRAINAVTSLFLSVPAFVAGPILIYFFAVHLRVLPALGWKPLEAGLGPNLETALMPAVAVALTEIAAFHRVLRADLISTLREDFVVAARSKGMPRSYVMFRHAFRPSSFALLTISGLSLARLIGGTIIVETLFVLPGLGQLITTSIVQRDVITVQGVVIFIAVAFVVINMLVDAGYGVLDPRVRRNPSTAKSRKPSVEAVSA
ncbi:ABC transporter permease [Nocardia carnea]|uniref:ABC transporter permease n=1 Tax=Nocardia carnea TaxID=37328 RepID=UPI0024544504|nr:ABC transporter permease [Nocardia carnea]